VASDDLDQQMKLSPGTCLKLSGVRERFFVETETASTMGAMAAREALCDAALSIQEVDLILSATVTREQPLPGMAAAIQRQLGPEAEGIAAFDINSACLSFMTAFDCAADGIALGRWRNVLIVSSEVASVGLNWEQPESSSLFGDGAAAAVVAPTLSGSNARILSSHLSTLSSGYECCSVKGGGVNLPPWEHSPARRADFLFSMHGPQIYRLAIKELPRCVNTVLESAQMDLSEVDLVIPHQASRPALNLVRKKLEIPEKRFFINIHNRGNLIAASIPTALHEAIQTGRVGSGSRVLLLGTGAGLTVGGLLFEL
jgi:3-oxoacyl-[acyl-carrier-protein] synthase-3